MIRSALESAEQAEELGAFAYLNKPVDIDRLTRVMKDAYAHASRMKAEGDEDKMTLAVDAQSNAIVVTAPSQLADEVQALAEGIDRESQQTVQVIPINGVQAIRIQESLKNLFGDRVHTGGGTPIAKSTPAPAAAKVCRMLTIASDRLG